MNGMPEVSISIIKFLACIFDGISVKMIVFIKPLTRHTLFITYRLYIIMEHLSHIPCKLALQADVQPINEKWPERNWLYDWTSR